MVCLQETLKKERQVDQPDQPCLSLDDALELTCSAVETCLSWWSGFPQESGPPVPEGLSLSSSVYRLLRTCGHIAVGRPRLFHRHVRHGKLAVLLLFSQVPLHMGAMLNISS